MSIILIIFSGGCLILYYSCYRYAVVALFCIIRVTGMRWLPYSVLFVLQVRGGCLILYYSCYRYAVVVLFCIISCYRYAVVGCLVKEAEVTRVADTAVMCESASSISPICSPDVDEEDEVLPSTSAAAVDVADVAVRMNESVASLSHLEVSLFFSDI